MAECTNKKFGKMLYAFELGILSDDDLHQFKLHLYECDYCFEKAQRFQQAALHLRHDSKIRESIHKIDEELSRIEAEKAREEKRLLWRKKILRRLVPTSVLAIVVFLILIFKPWQFEVRPTQEAIASENLLAIMYFDNLADKQDADRLGEITTDLLIADLSESHFVNVVSSQRLYDILKQMGREGDKRIDKDVATRIADKSKAKWMLIGSIPQVEPYIVITSQLIEVESGRIAASQHITGDTGETIFSLVDRLTVEIKNDLSLPIEARDEPDRPVTEVTTHSQEAYRYYLEGHDYAVKHYFPEAIGKYNKALELDSSFAMAYFRVALIKGWQGDPEFVNYVNKAMEFSTNAGQIEQWFIRALFAFLQDDISQCKEFLLKIVERDPQQKEAFFWLGWVSGYFLGEYETAIAYLNKAIEIDPLYKSPFQLLAEFYDQSGNYEKSVWAINQYIWLAPGEAKPYNARGYLYIRNGKIDQAIESYKKVIEIKPNFDGYLSLAMLGNLYLFKGEFPKAQNCYERLVAEGDEDIQLTGRFYLIMTALYQGKLNKALELTEKYLTGENLSDETLADGHLCKADIFKEMQKMNEAVEETEKAVILYQKNPEYVIAGRNHLIKVLSEDGQFARAEEIAMTLKQDLEKLDKEKERYMKYYWYSLGCIEFEKDNFELSAGYFGKAADTIKKLLTGYEFRSHFLLARSFLESGRFDEAINKFEQLLSNYGSGRIYWPLWSVKMHYYLGRSYQSAGQIEKAAARYREFLKIWKDIDVQLPEIQDAKNRLQQIETKS